MNDCDALFGGDAVECWSWTRVFPVVGIEVVEVPSRVGAPGLREAPVYRGDGKLFVAPDEGAFALAQALAHWLVATPDQRARDDFGRTPWDARREDRAALLQVGLHLAFDAPEVVDGAARELNVAPELVEAEGENLARVAEYVLGVAEKGRLRGGPVAMGRSLEQAGAWACRELDDVAAAWPVSPS